MDRDRKVISWRMMALFMLLLVVIFAFVLHGVRAGNRAAQEMADDNARQISSMSSYLDDLKADLKQVQTDEYVENVSRGMGFYSEGEIRFRFSDPAALELYTPEEWQVIMEEKEYGKYY